jgi:gliding motility-associated-like protein
MNPCGGGVSFFDKSEEDIISWLWNLEGATSSTVQNPYHFYRKGGVHKVSLTTTNEFNCAHKVTKELTIAVPPPVGIQSGTTICFGQKAMLHASGGVKYEWTPVETLDSPALQTPIASPSVSTDYSVVITTSATVNGVPCAFMLSTRVAIEHLSGKPVHAFANPVIVTVGEPSTLTYLGDPGATVTWLPLNSTTPVSGYTVQAYPSKPTTYTAVAQRGPCREPVEVHVDAYSEGCSPEDVFVPNTFTPNGDGENDIFRVQGLKVNELYFAVYNRWGERVYETTDRSGGWDGKYKGKDADVGVFGYYLTVKCVNGGETLKKGNVTLIR